MWQKDLGLCLYYRDVIAEGLVGNVEVEITPLSEELNFSCELLDYGLVDDGLLVPSLFCHFSDWLLKTFS